MAAKEGTYQNPIVLETGTTNEQDVVADYEFPDRGDPRCTVYVRAQVAGTWRTYWRDTIGNEWVSDLNSGAIGAGNGHWFDYDRASHRIRVTFQPTAGPGAGQYARAWVRPYA